MRSTRRQLLRGLLGAVASALLIPALGRAPWRMPSGGGWIQELFPDSAAVGRVARAYLAGSPDALRRTRALRAALLALPNAAAARSFLAARRCRDFETGDTLLVDGWVLAATEAEVCAIAHGRPV